MVSAAHVKANIADVLVSLFSFFLNVGSPYLIGKYVERLDLGIEEDDLSITVHVAVTFLSCVALLVWGMLLDIAGLHKGLASDWLRIAGLMLIFGAPVATLITALINPRWFVSEESYLKNRTILGSLVWPGLVKAPISLFRIGLSIATVAIPFVRVGLA